MPRAWLWASFYVLLIPAAAAVLAVNANGFYDANLPREGGTHADEARFLRQLTETVDGAVARSGLGGGRHDQTVVLEPPQATEVVRGGGPPGTLAVELDALVRTHLDQGRRRVAVYDGGGLWLEIGPQEGELNADSADSRYIFGVQSTGTNGVGTVTLSKPLSALVTAAFPHLHGGQVPSLLVDHRIAAHFGNLIGAYQGNPADASGLYTRMLYVSATTITTLGLGDVQPVSGTARAWIAAEAVAGVLLAGLFLNAIARSVRAGAEDRRLGR